jgi:hypothetical protein
LEIDSDLDLDAISEIWPGYPDIPSSQQQWIVSSSPFPTLDKIIGLEVNSDKIIKKT